MLSVNLEVTLQPKSKIFVMKEKIDLKKLMYCILPGVLYVAVSVSLPDLSHTLAAVLTAFVFIAVYYLLPKKLTAWKRYLISSAAVIILACIARFSKHVLLY